MVTNATRPKVDDHTVQRGADGIKLSRRTVSQISSFPSFWSDQESSQPSRHQLVSAAAIMVHVVVFGATGLLGSEITKALAAQGHSTTAVVRDATPNDANKTARLGEFERAGITVIQHDGSRDGLVDLLKNFTHVVNAVGERVGLIPVSKLAMLAMLRSVQFVPTSLLAQLLPRPRARHVDNQWEILFEVYVGVALRC